VLAPVTALPAVAEPEKQQTGNSRQQTADSKQPERILALMTADHEYALLLPLAACCRCLAVCCLLFTVCSFLPQFTRASLTCSEDSFLINNQHA
jgi:hypothetical protein